MTFAANWIPFEDPAGGPNFYRFDDKARYYINVDNTGDGVSDIRYRFEFKTRSATTDVPVRPRRPDQLAARQGPATSSRPTRSRARTTRAARSSVEGDRQGPADAAEQRRREDDAGVRGPAAKAIENLDGGGKVFAGQREDPFYASLGRIFDTVNLPAPGSATRAAASTTSRATRALGRPAGAGRAGHARRQGGRRQEGQQRGDRRVGVDRAPQRSTSAAGAAASGGRSRAWATRSSTR